MATIAVGSSSGASRRVAADRYGFLGGVAIVASALVLKSGGFENIPSFVQARGESVCE